MKTLSITRAALPAAGESTVMHCPALDASLRALELVTANLGEPLEARFEDASLAWATALAARQDARYAQVHVRLERSAEAAPLETLEQWLVADAAARVERVLALPAKDLAVPAARVSAVVTHKDLHEYLPACLASLRAQTLPLEIIVVDDGSGPDGLRVLDEEQARDPALRVVRQQNQGVGAARNRGIADATGDYVLIVDADNRLRPQMAERLVAALAADPEAAYATCGFRKHDPAGVTLSQHCPVAPLDPTPLLVENVAGDACALHRKDALAALGFTTDRIGQEDWELWLRYASAGRFGTTVPEVLFDYLVRPESMLRSLARTETLAAPFRLGLRHSRLLLAKADAVAALWADRQRLALRPTAHELELTRAHAANLEAQVASAKVALEDVRGHLARSSALAASLGTELQEKARALAALTLEAEELQRQIDRLSLERAHLLDQLDEMSRSTAVRAARALEHLSPRLHHAAGFVGQKLLGRKP